MNAEIIAVGSEMLTPERVDTNSLYLTGELNNLGVEVVAKCVVGDHCDRLAGAVRQALERSEIVILSGGLGPTEDDVTREAVAQALGRKLVFHPEIAEALERRFALAQRQMAEVNKRQALVIEGADVLPNDRGTAPGQWLEESGSVVMLLPGPPHELKSMFERQCLPRLKRLAPAQAIRTAVLRVVGMPESDLDQLISPVYKKYLNPVTTILAANGEIQVHLRARCATEAEADAFWRRWPPPSSCCSATASTPATATRSKWWSAISCANAAPPFQWPKVAPAACWASASRRFPAARTTSWAASSPTPTP